MQAPSRRFGRRPGARLVATMLVVAGLTALSPASAQAQWKWREPNGRIVVSDMPPPREVPDKDVLQRPATTAAPRAPAAPPASPAPNLAATGTGTPAAPAPAASDPRPRVDPELEARRKQQEQEQQARKQQDEQRQAQVRADNCQRAQSALRQLESGVRLTRVNDKGEREILDDRQREAEAQRARQVVQSECR